MNTFSVTTDSGMRTRKPGRMWVTIRGSVRDRVKLNAARKVTVTDIFRGRPAHMDLQVKILVLGEMLKIHDVEV